MRGGRVTAAVSETGSAEPIQRAKAPANSAGSEPDFAHEFEGSPEVVSGFSVNHVQVEKRESDQWEDSVRESFSGCSSDFASTPRTSAKVPSSCSSEDSGKPREGILRTRNSSKESGLTLPVDWRPLAFRLAPALRLGRPNPKVTDSGRHMQGGVGANRGSGRNREGGRSYTRQGRSGGRWNASSGIGSGEGAEGGRDGCAAPDLRGDREGNSHENPGADSGAISSPRPGVNPRAREGENQGEIRVANELKNRPGIRPETRRENRPADEVEIPAGDHRPSVAKSPNAGLLIPHPVLRFGRRRGPFDCGAADGIGCDIGGEIARRHDRDFEICSAPSAQAVAAPGDTRIEERPRHSAEGCAASTVVGVIAARSDAPVENARGIPARNLPPVFAAHENIRTGKHADKSRLGAKMPRAIAPDRAAELNGGDFSNSIERAKSIAENSGAVVLPFRPIRKAKHAGRSGPDPKSRSGIDTDCTLNCIDANFRENQTAAGDFVFGETVAEFANSANIRKTKYSDISRPTAENPCGDRLIGACDLDFSNFQETSQPGEISPATAPALAPIRRAKHFGVSSLNVRNSCAAGTSAPLGEASIFVSLKLNGFSDPFAKARNYIRTGELFEASGPNEKSRCAAGNSGLLRENVIFGPLKLRAFFGPAAEGQKHIRRGELFDTSCPGAKNPLRARTAETTENECGRKLFIFSEFLGNIQACFGALKHIRKAEQCGTSCPGTPGEFSREFARVCLAAGPFWVVNSGECLTEINAEKLPDFSNSNSQPASSKTITGINAGTLPDLAIPGLSESVNGINAQTSRDSPPLIPVNHSPQLTPRVVDSPFEQTRLADSSIRVFPVRAGFVPTRASIMARAPP